MFAIGVHPSQLTILLEMLDEHDVTFQTAKIKISFKCVNTLVI